MNDKCPYCGESLILDSENMEYVCPACGTVVGYEMLPSFDQSVYMYPIVRRRLDSEVLRLAEELFYGTIPGELKRMKRDKATRVVKALEALVKKRIYTIDWRVVREAIEVARRYGVKVDLSSVRSQQILNTIKSLVENHNIDLDPQEVYLFAVKHRDLWSGRKPETIAAVFTYLYARKLGKEVRIPMSQNTRKLVKVFEKVLVERGEI
ncbi:MAG: TFIIB-type zinc ribbon-containing protein [Ignisphaera sp.]